MPHALISYAAHHLQGAGSSRECLHLAPQRPAHELRESEKRFVMSQPIARVALVRDTYFGTTIEDPYRWMGERHSQEFHSWLQAQAAYTRTYLDALPAHDALLRRIAELETASPEIDSFRLATGRIFYEIREPGEAVRKLAMHLEPGTPRRILLDPNQSEETVPMTIDWYHPSHDGHYVAYGMSQGGSENSILHVLDVESGKELDLAISRVPHGGSTGSRTVAPSSTGACPSFPLLPPRPTSTRMYASTSITWETIPPTIPPFSGAESTQESR